MTTEDKKALAKPHKGVSYKPDQDKFLTYVTTLYDKRVNLGSYKDLDNAVEARRIAREVIQDKGEKNVRYRHIYDKVNPFRATIGLKGLKPSNTQK